MVLSGGLPVLPLLPKVTILSVFHLLTIVEDNGTILRPGRRVGRLEFYEYSPGFLLFFKLENLLTLSLGHRTATHHVSQR